MLKRLFRVLVLALRPVSGAPNVADFWGFLISLVALLGAPGVSAWLANEAGLPAGATLIVVLLIGVSGLFLRAAYRLQLDIDDVSGPKLRLGEPFCSNKVYIYPMGIVSEVKMWRMPLINDGGNAPSVTVTAKFTPALAHMPGWQPTLTLHQFGDQSREFALAGSGGEAFLDLIAAEIHNPMVGYVASVEAEGGYIYYEDDQLQVGEYTIVLEARAGRCKIARTVFAWFDGGQWMYMTTGPKGEMID